MYVISVTLEGLTPPLRFFHSEKNDAVKLVGVHVKARRFGSVTEALDQLDSKGFLNYWNGLSEDVPASVNILKISKGKLLNLTDEDYA